MKKALIFGISGQDGSYLAQLLLRKGYCVVGASRDANMAPLRNLQFLGIRDQVNVLSASLNDFSSVFSILRQVEPDEVYNLAGQSSVGLSFEQPMETFESISLANLNLLEALRLLGRPARYYNAGSSDCFGDTGGRRATEETPFRPRSPYAVAKAAAFWQVANYREAYAMFACSGILCNHESPLRPARFVTRKVVSSACRIAAGATETLTLGNLDIRRDWGWAPEYVEAMWHMLQQDKPRDYLIATGVTSSLEAFVAEVFACLGLDWKAHVQIQPGLFRPTDIPEISADPSLAAADLGWRATLTMRDVARLMVEAEQGNATAGS